MKEEEGRRRPLHTNGVFKFYRLENHKDRKKSQELGYWQSAFNLGYANNKITEEKRIKDSFHIFLTFYDLRWTTFKTYDF